MPCVVLRILSIDRNITFEKQFLRDKSVHVSEKGNEVEIITNDSTTVEVWVKITTLHENRLFFAGCDAYFRYNQQLINPPNFIRYVSNNNVTLTNDWKRENFIDIPDDIVISENSNFTDIRYKNEGEITTLDLTYKNGLNIIGNKLVPLNRTLCIRKTNKNDPKLYPPLWTTNYHILETSSPAQIWKNIHDCISKNLIALNNEVNISESIIHLLHFLTKIPSPKPPSTGWFSNINNFFSSSESVFKYFIDDKLKKKEIKDGNQFLISAVQTIMNYENDFEMQALHFGNMMKYKRIVSDTSNILLKLESCNENSFWQQFIWQMKLLSVAHENNQLFTNLIPVFNCIYEEKNLGKEDFINIGKLIIPELKQDIFVLLSELVTQQPSNWLRLFLEINFKYKQDYQNLITHKLNYWYSYLEKIFRDDSTFTFVKILISPGSNPENIMGIELLYSYSGRHDVIDSNIESNVSKRYVRKC